MRACILSGFAIPGDAHGIRLLCFVFDPFLGLLLPVDFVIESCRCQARGSCHKAAKPWPSIPCTLLGRRKELAFFSIFQHLQCFLNLCKLWVKDRKRYHALLKKAGKVIKVCKVDELADGLFDFFSSQVIKIQAWRKGGNLEVVCLVVSITQATRCHKIHISW